MGFASLTSGRYVSNETVGGDSRVAGLVRALALTQGVNRIFDFVGRHRGRRQFSPNGAVVAQLEGGDHFKRGGKFDRFAGNVIKLVENRCGNRVQTGALESRAQVGRHQRLDGLFLDLGTKVLADQTERRLAGTKAGYFGFLLESLGDARVFAFHFPSRDLNL